MLLYFYGVKKLFVGLAVALCFSCASKKNNPSPVTYLVTEDFEGARKDAYAADELQLRTGVWVFDDALIWGGATQGDVRNGARALRIRNQGRAGLGFDISNLTMVYLKHGLFGQDNPATWKLQLSANGREYRDLGSPLTTTSHELKLDSFTVADTGKVRIRIVKLDGGRLNIDDITFRGLGEPGIVFGQPHAGSGGWIPVPLPPRNAAKGSDAPPATGDNSNLLLGNPSNATADLANYTNYLIDHHYFVLSYNRERGTPNWVSWHLDETNITRVVSRQDNFAAYLGIPGAWYAVAHASYTGSGFDRGHNCPSADRTSSFEANSATFLMTNMIPQARENNSGPWADLEQHIRDQVTLGNEAYVIMGSYGAGGVGGNGATESIDNGRITVPERIWKVAVILPRGDNDLARIANDTRVIAVDMPNASTVDKDWRTYRVSVDQIEQKTGYDLLSTVAPAIQEVLERSVVVSF